MLGGARPPGGPGSALAVASPRERAVRRRRWIPIVAILAVLVLVGGGTGWWFAFGPGSRVTIPASIQGASEDEARAILGDLGLQVAEETGTIASPDIEAGLVADSDPAVGESVERNSAITILISTGPALLPINLDRGMPQATAEETVKEHWTLETTDVRFDSEVAAGQLLDALGADGQSLLDATEYGEKQPITLIVSAGAVPAVEGLTVDQARTALAGVQLTADDGLSQETYDDDIPEGAVISLVDPGGPLRPGDKVGLVISRGPEPVAVPAIVGMTWTDAKAAIQAAGLDYAFDRNIDESLAENFPDDSTVTRVTPDQGVMVKRGDVVSVRLTAG